RGRLRLEETTVQDRAVGAGEGGRRAPVPGHPDLLPVVVVEVVVGVRPPEVLVGLGRTPAVGQVALRSGRRVHGAGQASAAPGGGTRRGRGPVGWRACRTHHGLPPWASSGPRAGPPSR